MKRNSKRFIAAYIVIAGSLWAASQWWEKGLAKIVGVSVISPSGCYRIEKIRPFWILPDFFHPESHPDKMVKRNWSPWWGYPGFYRLYDNRSGVMIGESDIYDLESASGFLYWGDRIRPEVFSGMIYIGPNAPDCIGDQPNKSRPAK